MTMSRLRLLSLELDELMRRVDIDPRIQRRVAVAACRAALADVRDSRVVAAMSLIDSALPVGHETRSEMETLRIGLDKRYLELQNPSDREALKLFSQARAIASICCLLSDEHDLLPEAMYEAAMSMDDPSTLIATSLEALCNAVAANALPQS
jgi:hypothetical protein